MRDADKTKEELINELVELRQRMAELEASEAESQKATQRLRKSYEFLNRVLNSMFEDLIVIDREYCIVDVNRCFVERYGENYEDIIGRKCYEITHQRHRPCSEARHPCPLRTVLKRGLSLEVEHIHKDKDQKELTVQIDVFPLFGAEGEIESVVQIQRDITERKRAEEALQESERHYRLLAENAKDAIWTVDMNMRPTYMSPSITYLLGYTVEEAMANPMEAVYTPASFEIAMKVLAEELAIENMEQKDLSRSRTVELELNRKDGSIVPVEGNFSFVRGPDGRPVGILAIARDITERKQAEEREKHLQQELYLASRLASIGELTAGVAHEINNPLTGILGFSERLLRKSTDEEISRDLARVHDEAQRMARVVANLLTFARRSGKKKEYLDINEVLGRTLELRAYELRTSNIELDVAFTPSLPTILVDAGQIQQVFLNTIINAEQAITEAKHGGKLTIKTELVKDCVRISFADDGPGIPAENLDKLFDPFFTTRGEKGGIGLGLSICHGILTEHSGKIYVESESGKGATFFVELPNISGTADKVQKE